MTCDVGKTCFRHFHNTQHVEHKEWSIKSRGVIRGAANDVACLYRSSPCTYQRQQYIKKFFHSNKTNCKDEIIGILQLHVDCKYKRDFPPCNECSNGSKKPLWMSDDKS